ncbi:MAG: twin-arginine translocase TatA/TatE family subunit [Muribaculaceae bacterium]|nr:twin-arginine translocase TatA/TatE family subunit [Muribaculaceae bacterium]
MTNLILGFLGLGMGELLLIAFVIVLLFGAAKIPELMRNMGKGVRSFKEGMKEITEEEKKTDDKDKDAKQQ